MHNTEAENYIAAFSYMVGAITIREKLDMPPLPAKELLQQVYNHYGVLPVDSIVRDLGLKLKAEI
jgi:hypothetical protein